MSIKYYPRNVLRFIRKSLRSFFMNLLFSENSFFGHVIRLNQNSVQSFIQILNAPLMSEYDDIKHYHLKLDSPYPIFNPSIERVLNGEGFISMIRCTNFIRVNDGDNRAPDIKSNNNHLTFNYLVRLSENFEIINVSLVDDSLIKPVAPNGLEDVRLFWSNGRLMGIGAGVDKSRKNKKIVNQIVFSLDESKINNFYVAPKIYQEVEKNWVPLSSSDGWVSFVPSFIPIGFVDFKLDEFSIRCGRSADFSIRGGTPLISWGSGYLGIVHTPPMRYDGVVYYMHKIVLLDSNFRIREFTRPFFFQRRGIEFACGLVDFGEYVIVSYGVSDRSSHFMKIPKRVIQGMLGE